MGRHNFRCVSVVVTEMNECAIKQCDKTSILLLVVLYLTGSEEPGSLSNVDESPKNFVKMGVPRTSIRYNSILERGKE